MKHPDLQIGEWKEVQVFDCKTGDLIWMECLPGGVCVFLREYERQEGMSRKVTKYYEVHHPVEGKMIMPDYYFISLYERAYAK